MQNTEFFLRILKVFSWGAQVCIEPFELVEVAKQMKKMQNNKACGPDGVLTESLRFVDKIDPMLICDQMNAALEKGIPTVWRTSILTPLYKRKGNVTEWTNYRGLKLMCHGMKLYERQVEDSNRESPQQANLRTKNDARKAFGEKTKST